MAKRRQSLDQGESESAGVEPGAEPRVEPVLYAMRKNAKEEIRFSLTHYHRAQPLYDIRVYYRDDVGEMHPTKKGICVRPELLSKIREGLDALERALLSKQEKSENSS